MPAAVGWPMSAGLECSGKAISAQGEVEGGTGEPWAGKVHSSRPEARGALQRLSFLGNHPFFSLDLTLK